MALLLKYLNREIFELSLVLLNKEGVYLNEVPGDVTIVDLSKRGRMDFFRLAIRLANLIAKERPSLIVSFLTYTNYLTVLARFLSRKNIPVVLSERSILSIALRHGKFYLLKRNLMYLLYPHVARIIAISKGVKKDLLNFFSLNSEKVSVIYNAIDTAVIERLKREEVDHLWFQKNIPVLVACGRLIHHKNHAILIKSFAKLHGIDARLIILGEGEERNSLVKLIYKLGVQHKVVLFGFQKNPFKFIARSTVFIHPSDWEGFGNVIIEAMACGVPVISTRCPSGPNEIITNEVNGLLIPVGDVDALATATMRLLKDDQLRERLIEAGRKRANDFKLEKMMKAYEQVFLEVIESRGD